MTRREKAPKQKLRRAWSILEFAEKTGIGRNQAYEAAKRKDFETIKIGRRILVPIATLEKLGLISQSGT